jgi:hypothetical protein
MTDRESPRSAVLEQPADDTTRLVRPTSCEQTDPAGVALGRFLWAVVTAAGFRAPG